MASRARRRRGSCCDGCCCVPLALRVARARGAALELVAGAPHLVDGHAVARQLGGLLQVAVRRVRHQSSPERGVAHDCGTRERTVRRAQAAAREAVMLAGPRTVERRIALKKRSARECGRLACATSALKRRKKPARQQGGGQWRRADAPRFCSGPSGRVSSGFSHEDGGADGRRRGRAARRAAPRR